MLYFALPFRWALKRIIPLLDRSQDIYDTVVSHDGNMITMRFTRKRNTGDKRDLELNCQYFLYVWGGSIYSKNNLLTRPRNREVSGKEICLCPVSLSPTTIPDPTVTSTSVVSTSTMPTTVVSTTPVIRPVTFKGIRK